VNHDGEISWFDFWADFKVVGGMSWGHNCVAASRNRFAGAYFKRMHHYNG